MKRLLFAIFFVTVAWYKPWDKPPRSRFLLTKR